MPRQPPRPVHELLALDEGLVRLVWLMDEASWSRLIGDVARHGKGSRYDRNRFALYRVGYGHLNIKAGGASLYEAQAGASVTLLELLHFAATFLRQTAEGATQVGFDQCDDDRQIDFMIANDVVSISASDGDQVLTDVPAAAMIASMRSFVTSTVREIARRIPDLIEWETLTPVRENLERVPGHSPWPR